jgi:hypothetical protein
LAFVGGDLEANLARLHHEAEQVEVDRAEFEVQDRALARCGLLDREVQRLTYGLADGPLHEGVDRPRDDGQGVVGEPLRRQVRERVRLNGHVGELAEVNAGLPKLLRQLGDLQLRDVFGVGYERLCRHEDAVFQRFESVQR